MLKLGPLTPHSYLSKADKRRIADILQRWIDQLHKEDAAASKTQQEK